MTIHQGDHMIVLVLLIIIMDKEINIVSFNCAGFKHKNYDYKKYDYINDIFKSGNILFLQET